MCPWLPWPSKVHLQWAGPLLTVTLRPWSLFAPRRRLLCHPQAWLRRPRRRRLRHQRELPLCPLPRCPLRPRRWRPCLLQLTPLRLPPCFISRFSLITWSSTLASQGDGIQVTLKFRSTFKRFPDRFRPLRQLQPPTKDDRELWGLCLCRDEAVD